MTHQRKNPTTKTGVIVGVVAAVGVAAAAFAGAHGAIQLPNINAARTGLDVTPVSTAPIFQPPPGAPLSFADIFERVSPAVVSISVSSQVAVNQFQVPGLPFPFSVPQPEGEDEGETREAQAQGSGFFISADGYIVTNNHVVAEADEITVILKDERELVATVIGTDEETDLAVLKVDGNNYPFVNFENSAQPRVGDWVISIGNPFGLGGTATAGIVSAYDRRLEDNPESTFVDFMQIDSAINRGNSGGPTFDIYGRVIGVNSAIYSPSGGSVGIGFAIPATVAEQVTAQLIAEGAVTRGFLGASVGPFTDELAAGVNYDFPEGRAEYGALVHSVTDDGPAQRAGLREADVILSINGREVEDSTDLTRQVANTRAGENMELRVLREGEVYTLNVRAGIRPSQATLRGEEEPGPGTGRGGGRGGRGGRGAAPEAEEIVRPTVIGITLTEIDADAREQLSIPDDQQGVLVFGVETSSPAAGALRRGDLITNAAGHPITTPQQFIDVVNEMKAADREAMLVIIRRGGASNSGLIPLENE
jgi:serine protease Do